MTPKGQHGGADARRPLIQPPGGRQHGTCEPCHGTAATVAFAVAAGLHLGSPRTPQEAGETPPSSSSPAVEDPFWDLAVYSRRPIMRPKLGGLSSYILQISAPNDLLRTFYVCLRNSEGSKVFKPEEFLIRRILGSPKSRAHGPLMHIQQIVITHF